MAPEAKPNLATRDEVMTWLREQVSLSSQKEVADLYGISPNQISDVLHGRAKLSELMLAKLRWRMLEFFERIHEGESASG